ncbi:serine/threonine-protein kinase [Vulgatibacter incomptus]|uniref:Serine/threonine protein kinase n=1 Tax=Vulgatibacter incomptus TaxID=1391653 RepID=A0A0K1PE82_9BACT|nr:serine/threonine-protein kinase [Vulgatibacter incomptus]AKU91848.1 serine/threonine protein kinase [Vulgatibacter incomptus]
MASSTSPAEPFRPHVFGKFFLLQKLGMGGMAEIYRAKMAGSGGFEKELVIKRILPALSSESQFVRMLVNEAKLTVALTHPTIAQIFELGEIEGQYFISMELVEGATLHDLIFLSRKMGRPLTIEQSMYLCIEVLRGLEYAHKRTDGAGRALGIVHCDVSPDNVMVTWEGGVKLLDFGVARAAQSSLSNYKEGTLMGKLSYASPEQAEGERFDHRVDLFAVGVMFYELLTDTHPFGRVQTVEALIESRKKKVVPPSKIRAGLPAEIDAFVLKSLARSVENRFQTAKEMADELMDVLFPTPTSAVAEHLSASMRDLYRERIERQQRLRANDSLHIKVLANARSKTGETPVPALPAQPTEATAPQLPPGQGTRIFVSGLSDSTFSEPPPPGSRTRTSSRSVPRSVASGPFRGSPRPGLIAAAAAAGLVAGAGSVVGWQRSQPPALVVLSEPAGAEVLFEGVPLGRTPLVLDDSPVPRGGEVVVRLSGYKDAGVRPEAANSLLARAKVSLESSIGTLRVESQPPGARVTVDGHYVGLTPTDIPGIATNEAHRVELELRGYQQDSFVHWPHDPGPVIIRTLERL